MEINFTVQRVFTLENQRFIKAFVDVSVNNALLIKSVKVLEGKKGLFISLPQERAKDQKYYDVVRCMNEDTRQALEKAVLDAYNAAIEENKLIV